jgi:hypothetical protein
MIDGKLLHGGFADRLYGILSVFALCKNKNIPFKLYFVYPFDLKIFLVPNKYDWSINKNEISYNIRYSKIMIRTQTVLNAPTISDLKKDWFKKITPNKQFHFYSNAQNLEKINKYYDSNFTYHDLFNELFKPSEPFQIKLNTIINEKLGKRYIGLHFRFKNSFGDFHEMSFPELVEFDKNELLELCYRSITSFIKSDNMVFLSSDSQYFLNSISKRTNNVYFIPGDTILMDYKAPLPIHEKSFLDFFILGSSCKIVSMITNGKGLFKSNFCFFASQILNIDFEIIKIDTETFENSLTKEYSIF